MSLLFPFLTAYDPPESSEGTLDPLGLDQIADRLAVQLVPAVRERMQRIRFLTAMAVGAYVTEGLDENREYRDSAPYLVWEWLVIEALIRTEKENGRNWGVPGTDVTRRALNSHGYLDARSYLKTPRIFGFNGVYKRLAIHLGIVDVHLAPGTNAKQLVDAWARGMGLGGFDGSQSLLSTWSAAVQKGLKAEPPRTKTNWSMQEWEQLAKAFDPSTARAREKRCLRDLLLSPEKRHTGALPMLWNLQEEFEEDDYGEETLHDRLQERAPGYTPLLDAIRKYENFSRGLQDGFDVLRTRAARLETGGYEIADIAKNKDFRTSVDKLHERFAATKQALAAEPIADGSLPALFDERFAAFGDPREPAEWAMTLVAHHETIQKGKSAEGKRSWFDRLDDTRIFVRGDYRDPLTAIQPGRYVHAFRGGPIRRFWKDLG